MLTQDLEDESKAASFLHASQFEVKKEKYMGSEQLMQDLPSKNGLSSGQVAAAELKVGAVPR